MLTIIRLAYVGTWLNGSYIESNGMQKRWPLHPKPYPYETLERYVHRLAECYGVHYEHFCRRALCIQGNDSKARRFQEPTPALLRRLSDGTGIPVSQLEQMTLQHVWEKLMDEMRQYAETPEGQAELKRVSTHEVSQNS